MWYRFWCLVRHLTVPRHRLMPQILGYTFSRR